MVVDFSELGNLIVVYGINLLGAVASAADARVVKAGLVAALRGALGGFGTGASAAAPGDPAKR